MRITTSHGPRALARSACALRSPFDEGVRDADVQPTDHEGQSGAAATREVTEALAESWRSPGARQPSGECISRGDHDVNGASLAWAPSPTSKSRSRVVCGVHSVDSVLTRAKCEQCRATVPRSGEESDSLAERNRSGSRSSQVAAL